MPWPLKLRWMALYCHVCSQRWRNRQECVQASSGAVGESRCQLEVPLIRRSAGARPGHGIQWEYELELGPGMFPPSMHRVRPAAMKFFQFFPLVARSVVAFPLSYTSSTVRATRAYIPLIVVFISLFFLVILFLAVKLVYMKHRRIGTIHAPPTVRSGDKQGNRPRGLLVGCLGSPTWETTLTSKLDGATWRRGQVQRSSFAYRLHTRSTTRSTPSAHSKSQTSSGSRVATSTAFTSYSSHADQLVLPSSSGSSWHGSSCTCSAHRPNSHPRYGDFGEFHDARSPGGGVHQVTRRVSPSSIRLVDGPSHGSHVDYAFLSALPPNAIVASPLMGARDSFQLSRCSLRCDRRPVPPMPSLPLFLPFYLPNGPETLGAQGGGYLPPLRSSPLASVARVFYSQQQALEKTRVPDLGERSKAPCLESASSKIYQAASSFVAPEISALRVHPMQKTKSSHKRSHSCTGLAIVPRMDEAAPPPDDKKSSEMGSMQMGVQRTLSGSSCDDSVTSKKPLKSCMRQHSVVFIPSHNSTLSETSTQTRQSTGDRASLETPPSDNDIGILRVKQFHWNNDIKELKVQPCHMKKDNIALMPILE